MTISEEEDYPKMKWVLQSKVGMRHFIEPGALDIDIRGWVEREAFSNWSIVIMKHPWTMMECKL